MSKYQRILRAVRSRSNHTCDACGSAIGSDETYYRENPKDGFLQIVGARAFCAACYEKYGQSLLERKFKRVAQDPHQTRLQE